MRHARTYAPRYAAALRRFLAAREEEALNEAHDLGRQALADGLGLLEMSAIHHAALSHAPRGEPMLMDRKMAAALETFLAESLSPFEMTHQSFREAVGTLRRMNDLMESEAKRIAHALHDDPGQSLALACIALEELGRELPDPVRSRIDRIQERVRYAADRIRRVSHELRPTILDDLGLVPAVEFLTEGIRERSGMSVVVEGAAGGRLSSTIETALYRIVQEALANATKHARAQCVAIRFAREKRHLRCSIRDDGVGCDVEAVLARKGDHGLGLIGMRERLEALRGSFEFVSAPGRGTEVRVTVPVGS